MIESEQNLMKTMSVTNIAPEDAAKNIDRSKFLDIDPDSYVGMKPHFDKDFDTMDRVPANVAAKTSAFATQTEQHANLVKDDLSIMDTIERRVDWYDKKTFDIPEWNRRIAELSNKMITDGKISAEEQEEINDLNLAITEAEASRPQEIGDTEGFVVEGVSAIGDIFRGLSDNIEIIAGGTGLGAATGAGVGTLVVPGVGTLAGAKAGAIKGLAAGTTFAFTLDAYKQTRGLMYNSLTTLRGDDGKPLNLTHERKSNIAIATAMFSGITGGIAGKVLTTNNPLLKRFASPSALSKTLQKSPELLSKLELMGGLVKTGLAEGSEEGIQEFIQIVGEQYAKIDDTEEGFLNTLDSVNEAIGNSINPETGERVAGAAALGAFAGAGVQTLSAGANRLINRETGDRRIRQMQEIELKRNQIIQKSEMLKQVGAELKETKLDQLAPAEGSNFMKSIFGDGQSWMTVNDLAEFLEANPDQRENVSKLGIFEDELNTLGNELNFPVEIPLADAIQIVKEVPDFADSLRFDPDGESSNQAKENTQTFVQRAQEFDTRREELLSQLGDDEEVSQEIAEELETLRQKVQDPQPFENEFDYVSSVSFVEQDGIMTKDEAEQFNTTHLDARLNVAKSIREDVDQQFARIENRVLRDVNAKDIEVQIKELDAAFKAVDRFSQTTNLSEAELTFTENHAKKGFSPSAIDPASLTEDLREIFLNDKKNAKVLRRRKVFVEGGLDVEESAALNGFESGAQLLDILANSPTKSQLIKDRVQRKIELRNRINQTIKPARLLERDKAFSNLTKIYLREMKFMREKEWSTTKRGIIKIGRKVPTIKSLNVKAKEIVRGMRLNQVNPNTFVQGERVSQNEAIKNFVDGKFEQAFVNKEKAALNNELRKESMNAKDRINKNKAFWKKVLSSKNIQQELKDAGYENAMNDFTALYRLDGNNKNVNEKNRFTEFVKRQAQLGEWVPEIPERLVDFRASIDDMTVQQYQELTDVGRFIIQKAKLKNKLQKKADQRAENATMERMSESILENTINNVEYDPRKNKIVETRNLPTTDRIKTVIDTAISNISNLKTIALELDEQQFGGFFQQILVNPIKEATNNKRFEHQQIVEGDQAIVNEFYTNDEFQRMMNTFIEVPEFKGISQLGLEDGKGTIRKSDLLVMFAYMGDADAREAFTNFKDPVTGRELTIEEVQTVLDRELSENDALFAHNMLVKRWERFTDRAKEMHERTTGTEVQLVEGVEFVHRGKTFPGGYYPIKRNRISNDTEAQKAYDKLVQKGEEIVEFGKSLTDENDFFAEMRSAEMTFQGRLKQRTGSQRTLNLNFDNVFKFTEEMVHDIHMREPSAEVLKILKDRDNAANMTSVIGAKKYGVLINSVKDIASKTSDRDTAIFSEQNQFFNDLINTAHKVHAVQVIAFSAKSMAMQALSLGNVIMRHGPKSGVYLARNAKKILSNPIQYQQYVDIANKINPDIGFEQDGIDDVITKNSNDWMPVTNKFFKNNKSSSAQALNRIANAKNKWLGEYGFVGLRELDRANRVVTTMAIAEQFLNGDIKGFDKARVDNMTDKEKSETLRVLTQQTSDLSLTANSLADKTPIEKNKVISQFVRFFVDRRAGLNTVLAQGQKIKRDVKKGDYLNATGTALTTMIVMGAMKGWVNLIRDEEESIVNQIKNDEDLVGIFKETMISTVTSPVTETAGYIPFLDNIAFAVGLDSRSKTRKVSTPLLTVMSEFATSTVAIRDMLESVVEDGPDSVTDNLSNRQLKSLMTTGGYLLGGLPTNAIYRAMESIDSIVNEGEIIRSTVKDLNRLIDKYEEKYGSNENAQQFISDLKEYKKTLPQDQQTVKSLIPEMAQSSIKMIVSNGDWKKVNPETGASGVYQFTQERWDEIRALNPDLGLSENGRVSKDSSQQEKAMEWSIESNTEEFRAYEIPVTTENLLGAHIFGIEAYIAIHESPDNAKLSDIVRELADEPEFKGFTTVKSIKQYLKKQVDKVQNEQ